MFPPPVRRKEITTIMSSSSVPVVSANPHPCRFRALSMAGEIVEFDPRTLSSVDLGNHDDSDFALTRIKIADVRWKEQNRQLEDVRREQKKNGGVSANGTGAISYLVETLQIALAAKLASKPPSSLVMLFPLEWSAEHGPQQLALGDETMADESLAWQTTWTLEPQYLAAPAHFRFAIEGPDRFRPACKDLVLAFSSGVRFWLGFHHHFCHIESDFVIDRELLLTSCVKANEAKRGEYSVPLPYIGDEFDEFIGLLPRDLLVRSLPHLFPGGELVWPVSLFEGLKLMHPPDVQFPRGRPYSREECVQLMSAGWCAVTRAVENRSGGEVLASVFGSTKDALRKALRSVGDAEKAYGVDSVQAGRAAIITRGGEVWVVNLTMAGEVWVGQAVNLTMAIYDQLQREEGAVSSLFPLELLVDLDNLEYLSKAGEYLLRAGKEEGAAESFLGELQKRTRAQLEAGRRVHERREAARLEAARLEPARRKAARLEAERREAARLEAEKARREASSLSAARRSDSIDRYPEQGEVRIPCETGVADKYLHLPFWNKARARGFI